jgi:HEAT repeat protein
MALVKFEMLAEHKKIREYYLNKIQEALLAAVHDENRSIEVRRRALEAVAPLSLPQVRTAIMNAYRSHNGRLKISSIYAMGRNCDPSWLSILLKELTSNDTEIRYEAAGACGEIEDEEAVLSLISLINDDDVDVQMATIQALGKIGGVRAKESLERCLNNPSEAIRQTAKQALNDMEIKEAYTLEL